MVSTMATSANAGTPCPHIGTVEVIESVALDEYYELHDDEYITHEVVTEFEWCRECGALRRDGEAVWTTPEQRRV